METLRNLYLQNQSTINLVGVVVLFFVLAGFLTQFAQPKTSSLTSPSTSSFTPPYSPSQIAGSQTETDQNFFPYLSEGYYVIRGSRNQEYCSDDPTGLICNRNFVKDWEKFYVKPLGQNTYALRGGRGKWCRLAPTGLICDADRPDRHDTQFKIHGIGRGNQYMVRSAIKDPHFPSWCADYGNGIRCDHRDYNSMEIFTFDRVSAEFEGGDEKRWGPIQTW